VLAVDTNVLVYAADIDSQFHAPCRDWLDRQRARPDAWYSTWPILYEFLRVTTHSRVIPATGYYDWHDTPSGKRPYYFTRHDGDREILAQRPAPGASQPASALMP
jgi:predicted nucleic acid-binding protein